MVLNFIREGMPWVISGLTLLSMWEAGEGRQVGWKIALFNQLLWLVWIFCSQAWGLLPMNIALWFIYFRNYRKWA